jgi:hypothetical protein
MNLNNKLSFFPATFENIEIMSKIFFIDNYEHIVHVCSIATFFIFNPLLQCQ